MNRVAQPPGGGFALDSLSDETLQLLRAIYRGQREGYLTLTAGWGRIFPLRCAENH